MKNTKYARENNIYFKVMKKCAETAYELTERLNKWMMFYPSLEENIASC